MFNPHVHPGPFTHIHSLPRGKDSAVVHFSLPDAVQLSQTEVDQLWVLKPAERGTVKVYRTVHTVPRTQWNLGRDYRVSGMVQKAAAPISVHPALERLQTFVRQHSNLDGWQQATVNFYEHGGEYVGPHQEKGSKLVPGAPIYTFSFGVERKLVVHNAEGGEAVLTVPLVDNTCVVMEGELQSWYKTNVPKCAKVHGKMMHVIFRTFKD